MPPFDKMALITTDESQSSSIENASFAARCNGPWTWHLDPDETRMVEAAIEVCDGTPSYVERHKPDFPTYCPWRARVVGRK